MAEILILVLVVLAVSSILAARGEDDDGQDGRSSGRATPRWTPEDTGHRIAARLRAARAAAGLGPATTDVARTRAKSDAAPPATGHGAHPATGVDASSGMRGGGSGESDARMLDTTRYVQRDGRFAFVKSFGLDPRQLEELYVYTVAGRLEDLPRPVQDLLANLHRHGCALGATITAFLFHRRALVEGEAIYVAVSRASAREQRGRAVAFIDRHHGC